MRDDTEMNVATLDAELACGLRLMLWAEHLGLMSEDDLFTVAQYLGHQHQGQRVDERTAGLLHQLQDSLGDPLAALPLSINFPPENLPPHSAKHPRVGH